MFDHPEFAEHEQIVFCHDRDSGLRAIIAIHDTTLGPAVGGCRMFPYANVDDAYTDAMRLSRGMTFKAALARLPFGGGKSVILGDPKRDKSAALLRGFGRQIERLGGHYVGAEDMGIGVTDIRIIASETQHVAGVTHDPSPFTALGVFAGIGAAVQHRLGRDSLEDVRVAVQGAGSVGMHLCRLLHEAGARLLVADVEPAAVRAIVLSCDARAVEPERIMLEDAEVFAPCARGAILDDGSIRALRASIVAGAANNQLQAERHGEALRQRGILYAPDYVINAGGIIDGSGEILGNYSEAASRTKIVEIGTLLREIFRRADELALPTNEIANRIAMERLQAARR